VVDLLADPLRAAAVGAAAAAMVRARFGWDAVTARFADDCEAAVARAAARPAPDASTLHPAGPVGAS
jgi:hypothetical protein